MVLIYARTQIADPVLDVAARVRPDVPPSDLIPTGEKALRSTVARFVDHGITKFVLVPAGDPSSWDDELNWLSPIVRAIEN